MMALGFLPWWSENPYQILLKRELNKQARFASWRSPCNRCCKAHAILMPDRS